jgi:hypothetical protein
MYIPTWLIIVVVVIGYFYYKSKNENSITNEEPSTTEEMWKQADYSKVKVMEKSPLSSLEDIGFFKEERDMINAMENDVIRLRERYKHEPIKQKQIAQDWMDYANAIQEIKSAREMLDVDFEDGAYDRFDESVKESHAVVQEVTKRIEDELGKDSHLKVVHDRLIKNAEEMNKIFEEEEEKK